MILLSEYYQEKVVSLGRDKLITRELPFRLEGEIRIEQELFCWRLYSGKKYIECRSEDEAKYLQVFLDIGLNRVEVPKDDKYLKEILPRLIHLKNRHDEIIDDHIGGILSKRLREQAWNSVWFEIFGDEYVDYKSLYEEYEIEE